MSLFAYIWQHWLFVAVLSPFFMALVNILDIYFVHNVYEDEWDGVLMAGIFQLVPWILVVLDIVTFQLPGFPVFLRALVAGGCMMLAFYFYFKALFSANDMVSVQVLAQLSILVVPFFSWIIIGEHLSSRNYFGIILAFLGATILNFSQRERLSGFKRFLFIMAGMVAFLSLSMVLQEQTYRMINQQFWTGFLLFSAGGSLVSFLLIFMSRKSPRDRISRIIPLIRKNIWPLVLAESFSVLAIIVSQRAIDLSPSVSFVIVLESLLPLFVLLLSAVLAGIFFFLNKKKAQGIYQEQVSYLWIKLLASGVIISGVYLVS